MLLQFDKSPHNYFYLGNDLVFNILIFLGESKNRGYVAMDIISMSFEDSYNFLELSKIHHFFT
jgi:hypothetical protein